MHINKKNILKNKHARSVFEIVSEDGVMNRREIIYIIKQICQMSDLEKMGEFIHPRNIILNANGVVSISQADLPFSYRETYILPERDRFDPIDSSAIVYALGITMLYMATGSEKKTDIESVKDDSILQTLTQKCIEFDVNMRFRNEKEILDFIRKNEGIVIKFIKVGILLICLSAGLAGVFYLFQNGKNRSMEISRESSFAVGYSEGYNAGFIDAPGTGIEETPFDEKNGNLIGNINANKGAFAVRSKDEIFFIYNGSIFQMNPYTEKISILTEEENANNLNYYKGWVYYSTDTSLMRINTKTLKKEIVSDSKTGLLYIVDGVFYLDDISESGYLYRMDPSTGAMKQLNGIVELHCLNINQERLYYSDIKQNYNLYSCKLDGSGNKAINSNSCEWFCIYGDKIYAYSAVYKDVEKKTISNSTSFFIRMDLDGAGIERLSGLPAYYINVTDAGIFYVAGKNKSLEWLSHDSRLRYRILPENIGAFNIVGRWIFYQNLKDDGNLWRVRMNGTGNEKIVVDGHN